MSQNNANLTKRPRTADSAELAVIKELCVTLVREIKTLRGDIDKISTAVEDKLEEKLGDDSNIHGMLSEASKGSMCAPADKTRRLNSGTAASSTTFTGPIRLGIYKILQEQHMWCSPEIIAADLLKDEESNFECLDDTEDYPSNDGPFDWILWCKESPESADRLKKRVSQIYIYTLF
jgi:hypothetical protein